MPTRRRRRQTRTRKALLHDPKLSGVRPATPTTRVNNFKSTVVATVSKVIHTDNAAGRCARMMLSLVPKSRDIRLIEGKDVIKRFNIEATNDVADQRF